MSAIANIVIADGKATPTDHTYVPVSVNPNAGYRAQVNDVPLAGQEAINLVVTLDSNRADGLNRVTATLQLPVLEEAAGGTSSGYVAAPRVAYFITAKAEFVLPSRSDDAQRKDARVLLSNLLKNAQVIDAVDNLARPY